MVLPAPDGPTSATSWPGSAVNETSNSTWLVGACSSTATDSSDASDTSSARIAEVDVGELDRRRPAGTSTAPGFSAIIGGRSSTSKTRSNDTSAVITSTCTLESAVSGP